MNQSFEAGDSLNRMFRKVFIREDIGTNTLMSRRNSEVSNRSKLKLKPQITNAELESLVNTRRSKKSLCDENQNPRYEKEFTQYKDLQKKYKEMKEHYKGKICELTSEVAYYKDLYKKVVKLKGLE